MSDQMTVAIVAAAPTLIVILGAVIGWYAGDILGMLSVLRDLRATPRELPKAPWED